MEFDEVDKVINWQRILESFKFAYGMRTHLGDPLFLSSVATVSVLTLLATCGCNRCVFTDCRTNVVPGVYS